MILLQPYSRTADASSAPDPEQAMKQQNRPPMPDSQNPSDPDQGELRRNKEIQGQGARQYESGRNPNMQAQQSNRQGSGKATQQRTEDR